MFLALVVWALKGTTLGEAPAFKHWPRASALAYFIDEKSFITLTTKTKRERERNIVETRECWRYVRLFPEVLLVRFEPLILGL